REGHRSRQFDPTGFQNERLKRLEGAGRPKANLQVNRSRPPAELAPVANSTGENLGDLAQAQGVNRILLIDDDNNRVERHDLFDLAACGWCGAGGLGEYLNLAVGVDPRRHAALRYLVDDRILGGV